MCGLLLALRLRLVDPTRVRGSSPPTKAASLCLSLVCAAGLFLAPQALACSGSGPHYYGSDTSGSGANTGTGALTGIWSSIYVTYPNGFSDEAVWTINASNDNDAIEAGFYSGLGNNVAWTSANLPYYTTSNGNNEFDDSSRPLEDATAVDMYVQPAFDGNPANYFMYAPDQGYEVNYDIGNYTVSTPRQNYFQGETVSNCATPTATWMGGGTGEWFQLVYQPAGDYPDNWAVWGFQNPQADSPYFYNTDSTYLFENGGE